MLKKIAARFGTPIYVYDGNIIRAQCRKLKRNLPGIKLYYACKANSNPQIINLIYEEDFGVETVSPGEVALARGAGIPVSKITFTCTSIEEKELVKVHKQGIKIHLDSLHQVENFGKNFKGEGISVRLNLNVGAGGHSHLITGGPDSKFGINISQIKELKILAKKYDLKITGIHQHIGSSILNHKTLLLATATAFKTAILFPDLKYLDLGGGLGVPYKPEEGELDIKSFGREFHIQAENFFKKYGSRIQLSFEPGRYIVAQAGNLLVKVTDRKKNGAKTFLGINSGMNHLVRPAMYGAYHEIVNLNNPKGAKEIVTIGGNMCESGDIFAKNRKITRTKIGDTLAIQNAGAYGYVMASNYNSRPKPKEFLILGKKVSKI